MSQGDLFGGTFKQDAPKKKNEAKAATKKPESQGQGQGQGRELRLPSDHDQRESAVTQFTRPIMLEAGAGTGKTATLVARIVCWCMGEGWEASASQEAGSKSDDQAAAILGSIAAITFTEAAAAEMSTRVSEALGLLERASAGGYALLTEGLPTGLSAAHLPDDTSVIHERARALRGSLEYLNISTIHSFCRRILASNPLEVGLAPGFEVDATGRHQRAAVRAAMERYLADAWQDPIDPDLLALARERNGAPEIEDSLLELLAMGARSEDFADDPYDAKTVDGLIAGLEAGSKNLAGYLGGVFGNLAANQKVHDLLETLGELIAILSLAGKAEAESQSPAERLESISQDIQEAWSDRAISKLEDYRKGKILKGEDKVLEGDTKLLFEAVQAFELVAKPFRNLQPAFLNSARRVVLLVLSDVEQELRARGVATFNDLLEDAHQLLVQHPDIAAGERRRMGMLLVDEFQDTDQKQCDMVRVLALAGPKEERPSLFIVGDPKQSIFSWRNADLAAYDQFKDSIKEAGGELLQLTCNFRSTPAVLAEVTRVMQNIMLPEPGLQPPYVALEAFRKDAAADPDSADSAPIEHWLSWPEDPEAGGILTKLGRGKSSSYRTEAQAIASDIRARQAAGAEWQDFALILRSMTQLDVYLGELRRQGIPFEVQSDRSYYRRREIIDASALVRAALDPSDLLALVTLLRSPMVGLPDAALLPLWARGFPGQVSELERPDAARLERLQDDLEQVAELLPSSIPGIDNIRGWELSVMAALRSLAELRAAFQGDQLSIDAWVDQLRAHFLPDATEAARYLGAYRLANLERFFDDLLERFQESGGDTQALLRGLRSNLKRNERVDSRPPGEGASDTVKILTVHGSKGLEYNSVYLPQLHKNDEAGGNPFSSTSFDRRAGVVSYELFRASTPNRTHTEAARLRTERAERVRLFYVAMTRAKNRLVMLSAWGDDGMPKAWDEAKRYSELLAMRPGVKEPLQEQMMQAPLRDASASIDDAGAAWRMAALIALDGEAHVPRSEPVELPALALTAAKLQGLAEQRLEAEAYAARPYAGQASSHREPDVDDGFSDFEGTLLASDSESAKDQGDGLNSRSAMRVGTQVHHVLERYTRAVDLESLSRAAADALPADFSNEERRAFEEILGNMGANGTFERLAELEPAIIARELGILSLPADDPKGPTAFMGGAVDLVYRDPKTDEIVVVDYKTDRIQDEAQLMQRAQFYRTQGLTYVRAVREALALDANPRLEFWFLRCGRVATLQA